VNSNNQGYLFFFLFLLIKDNKVLLLLLLRRRSWTVTGRRATRRGAPARPGKENNKLARKRITAFLSTFV
jgi:hypothetical protein